MEGAFANAWIATLPCASSSAAVPDTLIVQENKVGQSWFKKPKRRTTFSQEQMRLPRSDFARSKYITWERGYQLPEVLGLNYKQVKSWFQNQRLKAKKSQTMPVCTTHDRDPTLPQLEPSIGPRGLRVPTSFHMDPVNNHPEYYSRQSNQVSEDWPQNYGEAPSPYQMNLQLPYPNNPVQAPMGHTGQSYPIRSQTSLASCALPTMQGPLPPLNTSIQGSWMKLEQSLSNGSEDSTASAPSPDIRSAPQDQSYSLMGPVLASP